MAPRITSPEPGGRPPGNRRIRYRWALAAALDARLPQVSGWARLLQLLRGDTLPQAWQCETFVRWGPSLQAEEYELSVPRGAHHTLERTRVAVVYESPDFGGQ